MKIIVLEGPDGAGKTTLADALEAYWSIAGGVVQRHHNGPIPRDVEALSHYLDQVSTLETRFPNATVHIFDRLHVGEVIYGEVLRGESKLSLRQAGAIDEYLIERGAALVYVTATPHVIRARYEERGDDLILPEMLVPIINRYNLYMATHTYWAEYRSDKLGGLFQ